MTPKPPPLDVAVVWHMHQPDYRDLATGEARMPWTRLHGLKDYYDMAAVLERFPAVHQTFNLAPSLVAQLEAAARGEFPDPELSLFERPAAKLGPEDRVELLRRFFQVNSETMLAPFPRYRELLERRGRGQGPADLAAVAPTFGEQDLRDLQILFHLAWVDPTIRDADETLATLAAKGRDFSEVDKQRLAERMRAVLGAIVPLHRRLVDRGQIEVSTSPFYHPILPLLCDTNVAREPLPDLRLPTRRFAHPEDAAAHLERAQAFMRERIGRPILGLWPSEGAVSEAILPLVARAGFRWLASDEAILARSLGTHFAGAGEGARARLAALYQPYRLRRPGGVDLAIVFRDHLLSDLIGFVYSRWDPAQAADDLVARLVGLAGQLSGTNGDGRHLVPIILDGENCWEHYAEDGRAFLDRLYGRLSETPALRCVAVAEHLAAHPPKAELPRLAAGSWINHNFRVWIGHDEDNAAWDAVSAARDALVAAAERTDGGARPPADRRAPARQALYAAEGSDWCWWYGDDHHSDHEMEFDALFRGHLLRLYDFIDRPTPSDLTYPIKGRFRVQLPDERPRAFVTPKMDGRVSDYYEWFGAGRYEPGRSGGAMHQAAGLVAEFRYGFDAERLYLRIDPASSIEALCDGAGGGPPSFLLVISEPEPMEVEVRLGPDGRPAATLTRPGARPRPLAGVAADDVIELAVPFSDLVVLPRTELRFRLAVRRDGALVEQWPDRGFLLVEVPSEDFEQEMWQV
jgi:alpha-amylase/alpha-mannosidase (GH57 family)